MDGILTWVQNIAYYLIFMSVVAALLPGKKYEKYIRFFAGMVLILLVLQPLTSGLNLDEKLKAYYDSFTFQQESGELKQQILGMEEARLNAVIDQYEQAVAMDLSGMADEQELSVRSTEVIINREEGTEEFGQVMSIFMAVAGKKENADYYWSGTKGDNGNANYKPIQPVESIQDIAPVESPTGGPEGAWGQEAVDQKKEAQTETRLQLNTAISRLKKKVVEYYGLEEEFIEIQLEEG